MQINREYIEDQLQHLTGHCNAQFVDHVINCITERVGWGWPACFEIRACDTLSGWPEFVYASSE